MEVACNGDKDEENVSLCVTKTIKRAVGLVLPEPGSDHRIEKKVGQIMIGPRVLERRACIKKIFATRHGALSQEGRCGYQMKER